MSRLLIIILLTFVLVDTSCGQKPQVQQKKTVQAPKPKNKVTFDITDSPYLDSLLKDTVLLKTFGKPAIWDAGEFVSTTVKIELPPKPTSWTSDYERIFTKEQVDTLNSIISKFEAETTNEIAIITIDSSWTTKEKFDSLVTAVGNYWGVGKKEKNNGIVIGISAGLRRLRISNGYGIEAKLSDSETKKIVDDTITPQFKKGNYFEGVRQGLLAITQKVR